MAVRSTRLKNNWSKAYQLRSQADFARVIINIIDKTGFDDSWWVFVGASKNAVEVYLSKWSKKSDTYKAMRAALARIAGVLGSAGTIEAYPWHELRYEDVRSIPAALEDGNFKPSTINQALSALRGVLDNAWRLGQISSEDYQKIKIDNDIGKSDRAGRALSTAEMDAVLEALAKATPHDAALIAVLAGAGLRRVEAVKLKKENYTPSTGRLIAYGKRKKPRSIPVGQRWRPAIEVWWQTRGEGELLFPLTNKDPRREVSTILKSFCTVSGLALFTPHDLRRTFATYICEVADIAVAQRLLGHENMQTTGIYDRRGEAVEDEAVKDL